MSTLNYFKKATILFFVLMVALMSCVKKTAQKPLTKFKTIDVKIQENGVKRIQNCANWYVDFSGIARSVVYRNKIICMGHNGGFACLNASDLTRDSVFEENLNTDFYTNVAVFQDTLFAEKFNKMFFWKADKWVEYSPTLPVKYFDLLLEDESYAFYSSCFGEFGSILFAYNKATKKIKANLSMCANTVAKTQHGYFVGSHLYHMSGFSSSAIIKNIEALPSVPDSLKNMEALINMHEKYPFLIDTGKARKENVIPMNLLHSKALVDTSRGRYDRDIVTIASFNSKGRLYHIIDPLFAWHGDRRFVGTAVDDSLIVVDTLKNCAATTVNQFGDITIINEETYGKGLTIVRNDTIFKVTFTTLYPDYRGPALERGNFSTDAVKKSTSNVRFKPNNDNEFGYQSPPTLTDNEFEFGRRYKIMNMHQNESSSIYIYANGKKNKLKLDRLMTNIFACNNHLFFFCNDSYSKMSLKYGMIEITDIEKFISIYRE